MLFEKEDVVVGRQPNSVYGMSPTHAVFPPVPLTLVSVDYTIAGARMCTEKQHNKTKINNDSSQS